MDPLLKVYTLQKVVGFEYNEIVKITSIRAVCDEDLRNLEGYIAGDAFDEKLGKWFYGVFIFQKGIVFYIEEEVLTSTG